MFKRIGVLMMLGLAACTVPDTDPSVRPSTGLTDVALIRQTMPSIVTIKAETTVWAPTAETLPSGDKPARRMVSHHLRLSSGVIVSSAGHVLTFRRSLEGMETIRVVTHEGFGFPARAIRADPITDLVLLQVETGGQILTPIPLALHRQPKNGDRVLSVSMLDFIAPKTAAGAIENANLHLATGPGRIVTKIDTTTEVPGSGGALVGADGLLLGIILGPRQAIGQTWDGTFALPLSAFRSLLDGLPLAQPSEARATQ
jgi:S1-C subfamily serine protease